MVENQSQDFIFQMGDEIKSKRNPKVIAIIGELGKGPNGRLAYQLFFNKSKLSGKFFPKDEVEKEFKFYRR